MHNYDHRLCIEGIEAESVHRGLCGLCTESVHRGLCIEAESVHLCIGLCIEAESVPAQLCCSVCCSVLQCVAVCCSVLQSVPAQHRLSLCIIMITDSMHSPHSPLCTDMHRLYAQTLCDIPHRHAHAQTLCTAQTCTDSMHRHAAQNYDHRLYAPHRHAQTLCTDMHRPCAG